MTKLKQFGLLVYLTILFALVVGLVNCGGGGGSPPPVQTRAIDIPVTVDGSILDNMQAANATFKAKSINGDQFLESVTYNNVTLSGMIVYEVDNERRDSANDSVTKTRVKPSENRFIRWKLLP